MREQEQTISKGPAAPEQEAPAPPAGEESRAPRPVVWISADQIGRGEETRWSVREEAGDG